MSLIPGAVEWRICWGRKGKLLGNLEDALKKQTKPKTPVSSSFVILLRTVDNFSGGETLRTVEISVLKS